MLNFKVSFFWLSFFLFFAQPVFSQSERIEQFNVDIQVDSTGLIHVNEQLDVRVMGNVFKRGIVRYLPLKRMGNSGKRNYHVDYDIEDVLVNGSKSAYHLERKNGNLYIYVGQSSVYLEPGVYHYEIKYSSDNQIGFFNEFDELYWNVTGNDWVVPIDSVTTTVSFPIGSQFKETACYSGNYGSQESNCEVTNIEPNIVEFSSQYISKSEGLTIVATIEPGVLQAPSTLTRDEPKEIKPPGYFQRNAVLIGTILLSIMLLFYYVFTFLKYGIDPPKPTVYPQFAPPDNMSPASVGYVEDQRYSNKLLTSSLVNLAIKGYIKIKDVEASSFFGLVKSTDYELERTDKAIGDELAKEEVQLLKDFFPEGVYLLVIDGNYDPDMEDIVDDFQKTMTKRWFKFLTTGLHAQFWIFPILVMAFYFVFFVALNSIQGGVNIRDMALLPIFFIGNFILLIIYIILIKRPTEEKLQLKSNIDGFELYLKTADSRQIQKLNPPELTPEVFEQNLPYAIALGVDKIWGKNFEQVLQSMGKTPESMQGSHFIWYSGNLSNLGSISAFTSTMNSNLTSSLASASTNPSSGSSSGGGGGGFSGGGGGGGGGGGW